MLEKKESKAEKIKSLMKTNQTKNDDIITLLGKNSKIND